MKIDLESIDKEQFMVHQHILNGEVLWLVQPQHIGCKWTQANKHFRSSLWNNDGELVSAGFPKFTNWGENPDNFPVPKSLNGTTVVEKLDGSLLIVSKYKGQYILRTRGTSDATRLDNGAELEIFKQTILPLFEKFYSLNETWERSFLFEWVSPVQKIILNYGDTPDWYLVGVVSHEDYSLWQQDSLDGLAKDMGLKRPVTYTFPTVEQLLADVELWKGKEGVCVYSKNGQAIHKVKGAWYLALHRMKEALASFDKVVDVWYSQGEPDYQTFEANITAQFDWELWQQCRGDASRICDGAKEVAKIVEAFKSFVANRLKPLPSRKEQAVETIKAYGDTNRASFIFKLLDGKELTSEDRKKLMYQVLKK
jgi:hypothetical protein